MISAELDDDFPPELVDVDTINSAPTETKATLDSVKVPITLITEFGDSGDIEKTLTVNQNGQEVEEWLDLANGCICCSVKDSGVNAIESLMEKRGAFDYILLETSGLADPGNIAPLFWVDDGLGSTIYLDGIVTLVDAKNFLQSLDEPADDGSKLADSSMHGHESSITTAHLQVSHADVIIINKSDTVSKLQLDAVEKRIQSINGLSRIHVTEYGQLPKLDGVVLDIHAYSDVDSLGYSGNQHSHMDPTISTISLAVPRLNEEGLLSLDAWIREVLWDSTLILPKQTEGSSDETSFAVHRLKGRVVLESGLVKMVQGVRDVFEITDLKQPPQNGDESVQGNLGLDGKLVLIGRGFAGLKWEESLIYGLTKERR